MKPYLTPYLICILLVAFATGISAQPCTGNDCVWPGDANKNGIVNNLDLLWIGLAMGTQSGVNQFTRPNASITWTPQEAPDWGQSFPNSSINFKHADTDGNGFIDGTDFFGASDNGLYRNTNSNFNGLLGHEFPGNDLFIIPNNPNPKPGDTITLEIHFGDSLNIIDSIYGVSFSLDIDTAYIKEDQITTDLMSNWMGTMPIDLFNFEKIEAKPESDFTFCRIDGSPVTGSGLLARVEIIIEDVILGKVVNDPDSAILKINFKNVLGINHQEIDQMITSQTACLRINLDTTSNNQEPEGELQTNIEIYPNPVGESLNIKLPDSLQMKAVDIIDVTGKIVFSRRPDNQQTFLIPLEKMAAGIYLIRIESNKGVFYRKVVVTN